MYDFNFTGLHSIFKEAIVRHEPTIAFPLANGLGRFLFLIFIPTDSKGNIKWSAIELFIILGRSQGVLNFDLKGRHYHQGEFRIRLTDSDVAAIRVELGLDDGLNHQGNAFILMNFLEALNAAIPVTLPLEEKVAALQQHRNLIQTHCGKHVEEASKIYLLAPKKLPKSQKPREETLRKLYSLNATPKAISSLVRNLKLLNWTASWTANEPSDSDGQFESLWLKTVAALRSKNS